MPVTTATRVYIARLAGLTVFDPNGDQVGRVRDAVARVRDRRQRRRAWSAWSPRSPMRRRIFLPIGRITAMEPDAVVLGTGTLNLRRFEKRPGEILVLEELLDRRVTIVRASGRPRSSTSRWSPTATGEWTLTRVAVREQTGRLGRRGHLHQLDWPEVSGLIGDAGRAGHRVAAGGARQHAPGRPRQRAAGPVRHPPGRGGRGAGRRAARRRARGAARARPGRDPRRAGTGARRRHPGGDGPGRRRRPARRAAQAGPGRAARPDGAGRGRHRSGSCCTTSRAPPAR